MKPALSLHTVFLAAIALALLAGVATRPSAAQTPRVDLAIKRAVVRIVPERCFGAGTCRAQPDQPGSGVLIHPSGLILTAWHVTSRDNDFAQENHWGDFVIEVIGEDDGLPPVAAYRAKIVATRPEMDLALLRIDRDAEGEPLTDGALSTLFWLPVYTERSSSLEVGVTGLPVLGFPAPRVGGRASLFTNQRFTLDSQNRADAELWVQWPLDRGYSGGPGLVWMDEGWQVAGIVLSQLGSGANNRTLLRDLSLAFQDFAWLPGEQQLSADDIRLTRTVDDGQPYLQVDAAIHALGWEGTPLDFQLLFFQADTYRPWRPARIDLPTLPSGQVYWSETLRPERPVADSALSFRVPLLDAVPPLDELVFQMKLAESDGGVQRWSSNRWHVAEAGATGIDPTATATPTSTATRTSTPPAQTPDTLATIEAGVRATLTASAPTATRALPTATPTPTPTVTPTFDREAQIADAVAATLTALAPTPTSTPTATFTPTATRTPNATATFQAAIEATLTALAPTATPTRTPTRTPTPRPPTRTPTPTPAAGAVREIEGITFVYVPPSEFVMGSTETQIDEAWEFCKKYYTSCTRSFAEDESPQRKVYVDGYWMMRTEVTNAQYRRFVDDGGYTNERFWTTEGWNWRNDNSITLPSRWTDSDFNDPEHPVVGVSWYEAVAYAAWLSQETGLTLRLPTEAEWEKAARGTDGRIYPWGTDWDGSRLNYCDSNCINSWADKDVNDGYRYTAPVGSYAGGASPYGAQDMASNVWEWVQDWYDSDYYANAPARNPQGPATGSSRVLRGGSWGSNPTSVRAAHRLWLVPVDRFNDVGFRLVAPGL